MSSTVPIRYCINNPHGLEERRMLDEAGCSSRDCFGRCSACFETRFLVLGVDGDDEVFEGDTYEDILAKIRERLRTGRS